MKVWAALVLFVCCIPSIASGQQAEPKADPPKFKLPNFGFDAVIVAQLSGQPGEETLSVTYPNYHQVPRLKTVTKYRTETRTRTVPVETSGGTVQAEQTYTVQIPYSEETEVMELVANDTMTEDMPLESLNFYDIKGQAVELPTLRQRLSRRTGIVYLGTGPLAKGTVPASSLYASILRSDLLFVTHTEDTAPAPQESDNILLPAPVIEP